MPLPGIIAYLAGKQLRGEIIVRECLIPRYVVIGKEATFRLAVQNMGIGAYFMIELDFIDRGERFSFESEWKHLDENQGAMIPIKKTIPSNITPGKKTMMASLYGIEYL